MRKWWIMAILIGALMGLQACAPKSQDACGFQQNVYGERISWKKNMPITFKIHESVPKEYWGAVERAAQTWNKKAGKTLIQISKNPVSGLAAERDRSNIISFAPQWDSKKDTEQAKTIVHWIGDQIQEADIKVNASHRQDGTSSFAFYWENESSEPAVNIEALILHEMGHALGMKHNDVGVSVMATYLANNLDRTQLSSADSTNLQCEY